MADLSVNKSDNLKFNESVGQNPILNNNFENAPSFTAATTGINKWIDGTAAGSSSNDSFGWALINIVGSGSTQFDNSTSNSGTNSIKLSTTATSSRIQVAPTPTSSSASNNFKYCFPVQPSTTYKMTWAMKTTLNSGSSTGAFVQMIDVDASGTFGTATASSGVATTTNWTSYSLSRTTASTANYMCIEICVFGNQGASTLIMDAWFDDINIQPVSRINGVDIPLGPIVTPGVQDISGPKIWS